MTAALRVPVQIRRGTEHWMRSFGLLVRRDVIELRVQLLSLGVIQLLMGAGLAVMYGFMLGDLDRIQATYVATGAPVLALVPLGAVFLPGIIAQRKAMGSHDFVWSLPVPRTASAAATCATITVVAIPGAAVALVVADWRYDLALSISPLLLIGGLGLGSLMMASIGYGIGHSIENPEITNLVTNLIIFLVIMFSPIAFPIEQFPDWLATVHRFLPFHHLAVLVRGGLTAGMVSEVPRAALVVGAWTVLGWLAAFRALAARR